MPAAKSMEEWDAILKREAASTDSQVEHSEDSVMARLGAAKNATTQQVELETAERELVARPVSAPAQLASQSKP